MAKRFLKKNEIRTDLNPAHLNKDGKPHDAYITAKKGHKLLANNKTHAEFVHGVKSLDLEPRKPKNVKHKRVSPPFLQSEKMFGPKQPKKKIPKTIKSKISRYNRKFKKKIK